MHVWGLIIQGAVNNAQTQKYKSLADVENYSYSHLHYNIHFKYVIVILWFVFK